MMVLPEVLAGFLDALHANLMSHHRTSFLLSALNASDLEYVDPHDYRTEEVLTPHFCILFLAVVQY